MNPYTNPYQDPFSLNSSSTYDFIQNDNIPELAAFSPNPPPSRSFLSTLSLPTLTPPRPSFSSSSSSSSFRSVFSTPSMSSLSVSPAKSTSSFFASLRLRSPNQHQQQHHTSALSLPSEDEDTNIDNLDFAPPPSHRFSRSSSHSSPSASSTSLFRLPQSDKQTAYFSSLTSRCGKKKRKLVITGIAATEVRKFEALKRWCESFGKIRSISRMPNGDLQIDFRDPEVAHTVCRLRAKVFISGVGSVQLSWTVSNNR